MATASTGVNAYRQMGRYLVLVTPVAGLYWCLRWVGWWQVRWAGLALGITFAVGFVVLMRARSTSDSRTVFVFLVFALCWLPVGILRFVKFFSGGVR